MKRRSALINITKGFGIVTLSPSITGVLQSCSNETNEYIPNFFDKNDFNLISKIMEIYLPETNDSPGASTLNLSSFVDIFFDKIATDEDRSFFLKSIGLFKNKLLAQKKGFELIKLIENSLRVPVKQQEDQDEEIDMYIDSISTKGENYFIPSDKVMIYGFLSKLKDIALFGFFRNEVVAKKHMSYSPVPGQQKGCLDLNEATKGKVWAINR